MNPAILSLLIFAEQSRVRSLGAGVRGRNDGLDAMGVAMLLATLIAIGVLIWALVTRMNRHSGRERFHDPRGLFKELCKAHELKHTSRKLLSAIAKHQGLRQPARIFLEPARLEEANTGPIGKEQGALLAQLRFQLYAEPQTAE